MSTEKLSSLTKYANEIKSKLSSEIPPKHKNRVEAYLNYLKRELAAVTTKLDALKLSSSEGKK